MEHVAGQGQATPRKRRKAMGCDESDRVRAAIMRLLEVTGPGPDPLVTAMWATGLHRAIMGPEVPAHPRRHEK